MTGYVEEGIGKTTWIHGWHPGFQLESRIMHRNKAHTQELCRSWGKGYILTKAKVTVDRMGGILTRCN